VRGFPQYDLFSQGVGITEKTEKERLVAYKRQKPKQSAGVAATILGCRRGRASLPPGKALRLEKVAELLKILYRAEFFPPG